MKRIWFVLTVLAATALVASPAHAQRGRMRNGKVYTANGMAYDMNSPEWRMAGGNIYMYQQIMAQKAAMKQQQLWMKQMQANQKAFEQWKKKNPEAYKKMQEQQQQWMLQQQKAQQIPLHYRTTKKGKSKKSKRPANTDSIAKEESDTTANAEAEPAKAKDGKSEAPVAQDKASKIKK